MEKTNKKFYLTTAIDYVNGPPHIGHAIQKVWADVIARFHRQKGFDVWFLTGTDEHGVNIVRTAQKLGKTPKELADENAVKFRGLREILNLSWDDFIRTSDKKRHWPGAELMWQKLMASGDIYKKHYRGLYCAGHEAFITAKDLVNGKCALHGKEPEVIDEENYFFKLSKYSETIEKKIKNGEFQILPDSRKNEILSLIKEGLEDVSFSRPAKDISWGIPVSNDPSHTMYVWSDALTNYLSAVGYGRSDDFKKWWPCDLHVLGKDNLRFHAAIWPGMLLSAGLSLPKTIFVHGFITVGGQKMSKTLGNIISPYDLVEKYGTDAVRYYFLREVSSYNDGDFTYEKFEERYNADLANGLGNFVSRVLTLSEKSDVKSLPKNFAAAIKKTEKNIEKFIGEFKFNESLVAIWQLIALGDKYVDDKKPWTLPFDSAEFKKTIGPLLFLISEISQLLLPFLPETSEKIDDVIKNKKSGILFPRLI